MGFVSPCWKEVSSLEEIQVRTQTIERTSSLRPDGNKEGQGARPIGGPEGSNLCGTGLRTVEPSNSVAGRGMLAQAVQGDGCEVMG